MNFVAQLEDCLRDLGAEARKKHPGVKEASERAILRLRTLQNAYASAVRKAASSGAEHPTTSLFQSQDLLHPFLLAANYPNASTKLLDISFKAMRLLMESDAVCPGDGIHMIRVWTIQAHVIMSHYQQKMSNTSSKGSQKSANDATGSGSNNGGSSSSATSAARSTVSTAASLATSTVNWLVFGGGSTNTSSPQSTNKTSSTEASKPVMINAVSSSSGQSGQYAAPSSKDMEKLGLEILSCLLKLTELIKHESVTVDIWTQSVSLCCLFLDFKKTVQQAAHSTLPQILSTLYDTSNSKKYNLQTWEDLMLLASYGPNKKAPALHGAFSQCRLDTSSSKAPRPPSPEFALDLMASIVKERPKLVASSDKFLSKTMGVTVALLQQSDTSNNNNNDSASFNLTKTLRVYQWTLALLQTQATATIECREILLHIIKPIRIATDMCRSNNDFEDGFVYNDPMEGTNPVDGSGTTNVSATAMNRSSRRLGVGTDAANSQASTSNGNNKTYTSLVPTALLWKAGLAAETVYHILLYSGKGLVEADDAKAVALKRLLDKPTIITLTETLSDFASVGAGCECHILQLADACHRLTNNAIIIDESNHSNNDLFIRTLSRDDDLHQHSLQNPLEPMMFLRAEQLMRSGINGADFDEKISATSGSSSSYTSPIVPVMGEALWTSFHGILEMILTVLPNASPENADTLMEGAFAPSLSALQHFMKRIPGSRDLTRLSLKGYTQLAHLCMPSNTPERIVRRKTLLTSLCKLSLPSWGKHDATSQVRNHHVRALVCLLRIVHTHYDHIVEDWDMVLHTFEELSVMTISSPFLSDQMYHAALAVSAVYGRFAAFSTCFSDESLREFIDALSKVSSSAAQKRDLVSTRDISVLDRVLVSKEPTSVGEKIAEESKESIGGKLVNLGVRAIYGSNQNDMEDDSYDVPIAKRTKSSFYEAYRNDFVLRLETTISSSLRPEIVAMFPFGLALLADVAMSNSFRYKTCMSPISQHICDFASVAPAISTAVMDTVAMLILAEASSDKNLIAFNAPAKVVYENPKQHQLLAVEPAKAQEGDLYSDDVGEVSQSALFGHFCDSIRTTSSAAVAESAITVLTSILESDGHTLTGEVWVAIIDAIASIAGDASDRTSSEWSNCCMLGFRCLKLIVDDFSDNLPQGPGANGTARSSLLDCCASFGRSRHDVNTSLTAIGLLWTIADQEAGTEAIDRALAKLMELASDSRPEVRNCSVNTLFSCIAGRGNGFSASQWEYCICTTVFGVYSLVVAKANDSGDGKVDLDGNAVETTKSRYKVNVHHSRDSAGKQWVATQVLTLQGLSRVLRSFFSLLLDHVDDGISVASSGSSNGNDNEEEEEESESYDDDDESGEYDEEEGSEGTESEETTPGMDKDRTPWLVQAWSRILDFALQAAAQEGGRDTVDLRYAGVELLVLLGQLSCKAGITAAITPARVGTNMQVVNGALKEVRNSNSPKSSSSIAYQRAHSMVTNTYREKLFASTMARMDSYREFIERLERSSSGMEATQVQVLQRFVSSLSNLYDCCKENEMSPQGDMVDSPTARWCSKEPEMANVESLEGRFVQLIITVAEVSSGGPRFLSQAQRSAVDALRSMVKQGSPEALLCSVRVAGSLFFCRKDDGGQENASVDADESGAVLLRSEFASFVAEEIVGESISPTCKVLALWVALSQFPSDEFSADRNSTGRRKACYKHFLPLLKEGLKSTATDENIETDLTRGVWLKLSAVLSHMLSPIPDTTNLLKISRADEVMEIVKLSTQFAPAYVCSDLCVALSKGASEALAVEKANRTQPGEKSEGEIQRKHMKYREDALSLFKKCFAGVCMMKSDDPGLLAITDKAFSDALATINESPDSNQEGVSVDMFLMVCKAFEENPGLEGLIVSSFPLLCRLVQTNHQEVRNAAAAALGSIDLRQVLADAQTRYEEAEQRAEKAEKEAKEMATAIADLQGKNEILQEKVNISSLRLT